MKKNARESNNISRGQAEEKNCELENRNFEIIWSERKKDKRIKNNEESLCDLRTTIKNKSVNYWSSEKEREWGQKVYLKK